MNEAPTTPFVLLDQELPLSQTSLWARQRDYYQEQGIEAWAGKVPFYVTSNPYIANSYAMIVVRFLQDGLKRGLIDPGQPVYLLELAAGSGSFSHFLLDRLQELTGLLSLDLDLKYVMTDLVRENIEFWRSHDAFQPYKASGMLDFACFDVEAMMEIELLESGRTLRAPGPGETSNPLIVIANYCFDSLRHDVFHFTGQEILEGLCTVTTEAGNVQDGHLDRLEKAHIDFDFRATQLPYYHLDILNDILARYRRTADQQYLAFPVGPLMGIDHLRRLAGDHLLLISSDKGFSKHLEIYQQEVPGIVFHDNCFSISVNFDAISQYFDLVGGDSFHQFTEQSLTTSVFVAGSKFSQLPETSLAMDTHLNSFGHSALNQLFLSEEMLGSLSNIEAIMPFLGASKWDARVFHSCRDVILDQVRNGYARVSDIADLKDKLPSIERNFYMLPNAVDTFFDIAVVLQETCHYDEALGYYHKSIRYFGEREDTVYNMGLCHYFLRQPEIALQSFHKALAMNNSIMTRGWISQVESEMAAQMTLSASGNTG